MTVYLDMAATTPVSEGVADVVRRYMTEDFGNAGSRTHELGGSAKRAVADAREKLARMVDVSSEELIFTSGATESNNIALLGLAEHGRETGRMHVVSSATEHKAVLEPLQHLASQGFDVELLKPDMSGRFTRDHVMSRVRPDTLLVSLMHVNNETGVMQPVAELAAELVNTSTYLHVDAAQSFAKIPVDLRAPIDLTSISGHKVGAPKGIGALVVRRRGWTKPPLRPLMFGGGQERGLRPGTLPVPLIAGLAAAAQERTEDHGRWYAATRLFRERLMGLVWDLGGIVNGDTRNAAPHILNFSIPGIDSEAMVVATRDLIAVATGSACTSASYTPSHVLTAMGLDEERVLGAVRASWWGIPELDLGALAEALRALEPARSSP